MQIETLIEQLQRKSAYPYEVETVEVTQTHISVVFLAGDFVYKIKKSVELGFLDFSSLEKRRLFCEEEVRLNRRLAHSVYLGVVPVTLDGDVAKFEGNGAAVEWAVKMHRLSQDATLKSHAQAGNVTESVIGELVTVLQEFYRSATRNEKIASLAKAEVIAGNIAENFEQTKAAVGTTVSSQVFETVKEESARWLQQITSLLNRRAETGYPCDAHGDLRLDHVYYFPERNPNERWVIIDCIEFSERFRACDPIADVAFLAMDLEFSGHKALSKALQSQFCGDREQERELMQFFMAYRAVVRAKVEGMELSEQEIPGDRKKVAVQKARGHWLLAHNLLSTADRRSCLVLVGGLPGVGKSTLARTIAEAQNFEIIRSDVVRKKAPASSIQNAGKVNSSIYSQEQIDANYTECLRLTEERLFEGERVIVDASFAREKHRELFANAARRWSIPILFVHCIAAPDVARIRLENRSGDASDADWNVYLQKAKEWEPLTAKESKLAITIDTAEAQPMIQIRQKLRFMELVELSEAQ